MTRYSRAMFVVAIFIGVIPLVYFYVNIYIFAATYDWMRSKEEKYFNNKLNIFRLSGEKVITIKELTNFEWDEVCYIGSYAKPSETIIKNYKLNKDIQHLEFNSLEYFIFLKNKEMEGIVIPEQSGWFWGMESTMSGCGKRNDTYLKIGKLKFIITN